MTDPYLETVRRVTAQWLNLDADKLRGETRFVEDLGCDSLDFAELIMAFEDAFDVDIPDSAVENVRTLEDAAFAMRTRAASTSSDVEGRITGTSGTYNDDASRERHRRERRADPTD